MTNSKEGGASATADGTALPLSPGRRKESIKRETKMSMSHSASPLCPAKNPSDSGRPQDTVKGYRLIPADGSQPGGRFCKNGINLCNMFMRLLREKQ